MPHRRTRALVVALVLTAVAILTVAALSGASPRSKKPPRIITATATYQRTTGKVAFSVEVQRRPKRVTVFHGGTRLPAHHVRHLQYWWETHRKHAAKRRCYPIRVKARNRHGLSTRQLGAGRVGTKGCPGLS